MQNGAYMQQASGNWGTCCKITLKHTVDGRNPAPVDIVNIPFFLGFYTFQVVQDFSHQQYHKFIGLSPVETGKMFFCAWPIKN